MNIVRYVLTAWNDYQQYIEQDYPIPIAYVMSCYTLHLMTKHFIRKTSTVTMATCKETAIKKELYFTEYSYKNIIACTIVTPQSQNRPQSCLMELCTVQFRKNVLPMIILSSIYMKSFSVSVKLYHRKSCSVSWVKAPFKNVLYFT